MIKIKPAPKLGLIASQLKFFRFETCQNTHRLFTVGITTTECGGET